MLDGRPTNRAGDVRRHFGKEAIVEMVLLRRVVDRRDVLGENFEPVKPSAPAGLPSE
jgi:hypothetical protein